MPHSPQFSGVATPFSARREMAAWLGFLLIALNLLLAPLLGYRPMAIDETGITICTSNGMQQVDAGGNTLPAKNQDMAHHCAYCLPLAGQDGGFTAPVEIAALPASQQGEIDYFSANPAARAAILAQGGFGRGPPAQV